MNILAPVNTMESAASMIESGADELYLGADDGIFQCYSFTGRGKWSYHQLKVLPSFNELKNIVAFAHDRGVKINFLGNTPFFSEYEGNDLERSFFHYLERGMECGVDSIVIGDIGLLYAYHEKGYRTPVHASLYFRTVNTNQLLFLKSFGVKRTTLSYQVSYQEIAAAVQSNIMEIEVPGYLGCSFFNGACNFLHELGEGIADDFDQGIACKSYYKIKTGEFVREGTLFDSEMGCSLCVLKDLDRMGVKAIKIVGRDRDYKRSAKVVELFQSVLKSQSDDAGLLIPEYWQRIWCQKGRCKYLNSPYLKYFI